MSTAFWNKKRVLVTGHEGFLGSWLSIRLLDAGAKVIGIDRVNARPLSVLGKLRHKIVRIKGDIARPGLVKAVIQKHRPEVIFHLAAEAIVGECAVRPLRAFTANIQGTWNVLEHAREAKSVKAIVAASSDKAYGSHTTLPYREDVPLQGDHPYDVSKSCADLICHTYSHTYGVPVCVTRCGNIYGPGDFHFSRIVPDTIRCALKGQPVLIRSDGKFTRDYIYVDDIASGYMMLAEQLAKKHLAGEAFNLSDEKPLTVLELVNKIFRAIGQKPNYRILNEAQYEIKHQYLSSRKARRILGWKPRHTPRQALSITIDWYRKHLR
ncbi:MAG: GDP-mannose 4,6-dehydratase [bacterium]